MRQLQDRADETLHDDPNVVTDVHDDRERRSSSSSNQGITFTFLKPPDERQPIARWPAEMMGKLSAIPGVFAFLRPFPVLEISTGATNQNQGQYAFAVSGVEPRAGLRRRPGSSWAKLHEYPGFADHLVRLLQQHAQPGHRAPAGPGQDVRGLGERASSRSCATRTRRTTST